jgi:DNA-directed RNA polymerase specialized sigma subunit
MLKKIAYREASRFHVDPEETLANASLYFVEAYYKFDPEKGSKMSSWVWFYVQRNIRDQFRHSAGKSPPSQLSEEAEDQLEDKQNRFRQIEIEDATGGDARIVLRLLREAPEELLQSMRDSGVGPHTHRRGLKTYLIEKLKWTASQVKEAFEELRDAIS